jgi:Ca-activated chloride channel family protein
MLNPFDGWGLTFAAPAWLLALLAIPALAWLLGQRGPTPAVAFPSVAPLRALGRPAAARRGFFKSALFFLALALLILAAARPQAARTLDRIKSSGVDILLAIDVSRSMLIEDFSVGGQRANRLETVKEVTRKFIDRRPNDRVGIVAFAGRPYLVSPLTLDHDWVRKNLERTTIGLVEDGTAIGSAIASAANRLRDRKSRSRVLVLLTDGENNAGKIDPETAAEAARALGIRFYAVGAGTNGVAPGPVFDHLGRLATDRAGRPLLQMQNVRFNDEGLQKIAAVAGGKAFRASDTASLESVYNEIDRLEKTEAETRKFRETRDFFQWFIAAGIAVLALEFALGQTLWRRAP